MKNENTRIRILYNIPCETFHNPNYYYKRSIHQHIIFLPLGLTMRLFRQQSELFFLYVVEEALPRIAFLWYSKPVNIHLL